MWLAITMPGNMSALQSLQRQRCGKRRAKINESLCYKMPKCGTQSIGKKAAAATITTATTRLSMK